MKKLFLKWQELSKELSSGQKFGLAVVLSMGLVITVGFLVLVIAMSNRERFGITSSRDNVIRESVELPMGAVIQNFQITEKENVIFQVGYDKKQYLYLYKNGESSPQRIVNIKYK